MLHAFVNNYQWFRSRDLADRRRGRLWSFWMSARIAARDLFRTEDWGLGTEKEKLSTQHSAHSPLTFSDRFGPLTPPRQCPHDQSRLLHSGQSGETLFCQQSVMLCYRCGLFQVYIRKYGNGRVEDHVLAFTLNTADSARAAGRYAELLESLT